jgi:hypothetical protein
LKVESVDFGETEVGTSKQIVITMKNNFNNIIRLSDISLSDPEVRILQFPDKLFPQEQKEMILIFEPNLFRRHPLELSNINFKVTM